MLKKILTQKIAKRPAPPRTLHPEKRQSSLTFAPSRARCIARSKRVVRTGKQGSKHRSLLWASLQLIGCHATVERGVAWRLKQRLSMSSISLFDFLNEIMTFFGFYSDTPATVGEEIPVMAEANIRLSLYETFRLSQQDFAKKRHFFANCTRVQCRKWAFSLPASIMPLLEILRMNFCRELDKLLS